MHRSKTGPKSKVVCWGHASEYNLLSCVLDKVREISNRTWPLDTRVQKGLRDYSWSLAESREYPP